MRQRHASLGRFQGRTGGRTVSQDPRFLARRLHGFKPFPHGQRAPRWAVQDSNLRPPACKGEAAGGQQRSHWPSRRPSYLRRIRKGRQGIHPRTRRSQTRRNFMRMEETRAHTLREPRLGGTEACGWRISDAIIPSDPPSKIHVSQVLVISGLGRRPSRDGPATPSGLRRRRSDVAGGGAKCPQGEHHEPSGRTR